MATNPCIAEASKALGRELTDDEAINLFEEVQDTIKKTRDEGAGLDDAIMRAKESMIAKKKTAAYVEKKNAYIQFKLRQEGLDFVFTKFKGKEALGMEALLVGVNSPQMGGRFSAAVYQLALSKKYHGGLMTELQRSNLQSILTSGDFDKELYRALFQINRKVELPYDGPKKVLDTARIIKKYFELMRNDYNNAGANIDMLEGYMGRQSHDADRMVKAKMDAWIEFILPKLDIDRTFEGGNPRDILKNIYNNLISGSHLTTSENATGFKGGTFNLGKRASQDRVLHFKDADSWYEYNQQFGYGNLVDTVSRQMDVTAQNIGLMSVFGPNPMDNFNRMTDMIANTLQGVEKKKFNEDVKGFLTNRFNEVSGISRIPVNKILAEVSRNVRVAQTTADLGAAVFASVSDLSTIMAELRYQGMDPFKGVTDMISGLTKGRNEKELAEIYSALGVIFDNNIGGLNRMFSARDAGPGLATNALQLFFKYTGLSYWTDIGKSTFTLVLSNNAALNKGKTFKQLHPDTQKVYSQYGIDAEKWDMFRQTAKRAADGREYLLPDQIANLPNKVFEDYLTKRNIEPSETAIAELKREVEMQWRSYFVDRTSYAVLEPDARTRSIMNQEHKPGTVMGTISEFFWQYKSFTVAYTQKVLGREIYGRGSDTLMQALKNGNGEMQGLAQVILWSTIFGYGAMTIKALIAGKTPRTAETPGEYLDLVRAALLQGGGAGIYGDFLFGEMKSRYGAGPLETFLGPTFANLSSLADLYGRARSGDDTAGSALKFVINNLPGNNIWWAKMALDYGVTYRLQEALNPGYLERMQKRLDREMGQSYLFPPAEVIR